MNQLLCRRRHFYIIFFLSCIIADVWMVQSLSCGASCCQVASEEDLLDAVSDEACVDIHVGGEIYVTSTVTIRRSLYMRGVTADAAIVQTHPGRDGVVIRDVTTGVSITELTINASNAQAALVVANANNVRVTAITVYGSASIFAVFFAGRDVAAGQASLDNFASRVDMDTNNSIADSIVSSPWTGDSLSFSLQYLGSVRNNTVIDGWWPCLLPFLLMIFSSMHHSYHFISINICIFTLQEGK
jgi:hypothetical protein